MIRRKNQARHAATTFNQPGATNIPVVITLVILATAVALNAYLVFGKWR